MDRLTTLKAKRALLIQQKALNDKIFKLHIDLATEAIHEELSPKSKGVLEHKFEKGKFDYKFEPVDTQVENILSHQDIFNAWWYENGQALVAIYALEIDPGLAVLSIAEKVWRAAKGLEEE